MDHHVFWAKTDADGQPGLSVYDHMMDVGCVARLMAEASPRLLKWLDIEAAVVGALAALHDLGKVSPGFQRKCPTWLKSNGLEVVARNGSWDTMMESNHGRVTHAAVQAFLLHIGADRKTAKFLSSVLGGHHGRLAPPTDRNYLPPGAISESLSRIDWDAERLAHANHIWNCFAEGIQPKLASSDSPSLWWIAGLTAVADWIGSDARFFPNEARQDVEDGVLRAKKTLAAIQFVPAAIAGDLSFHDLFHDPSAPEVKWVPNDMQEKTVAMVQGPGVYVIEAPMGLGKTEAALWAAYGLLASRKATGVYFALPTQATSNRIHARMNDFLGRISLESPASRLIHGSSWLLASDPGVRPGLTTPGEDRSCDARAGLDWFASPKRALLAPYGVGTVDQALLGIVASKHFFVRQFALAGKVVILDEVHSYDLYTGTLVDKLITTLEALGCTVIILSATLTGKRRKQIVQGPEEGDSKAGTGYPLISGRAQGSPLTPLATASPTPQEVHVQFADLETVASQAVNLAIEGGAVLWICNTVDSAQGHYQHFKVQADRLFRVGLLHSRFPFTRRERLENEWMERLGKNGRTRCGSILVSTQIVEQSVDLDADFMVSELAPTDMLLQRLGRLWRHKRAGRPIGTARLSILEEEATIEELRAMEPLEIVKALGNKANVYAPFVLLRTLDAWKRLSESRGFVVMPTEIRELIEATYAERKDDPPAWNELAKSWFEGDDAKKMKALRNTNLWQAQLEDEEGVQTRLNEFPTLSLILCRSHRKREVTFLDGSKASLSGKRYELATAQALHRNLVKIPKYCFDRVEPCGEAANYVRGAQTLGKVDVSGTVAVKGLKAAVRLRYSDDLGLVIEKSRKEGA